MMVYVLFGVYRALGPRFCLFVYMDSEFVVP